MTPNTRRTIQLGSLAFMFVLLCVLRLWFAIFVFIGAGILMTVILRRRTYCGLICPMGTLGELTDQQKQKGLKGRYLWIPVFVLFFGYIGYVLFTYNGYEQAIWYYLLRLVIAIAILSILVQLSYKKRTWCTRLCPVGIILSVLSKGDNLGPEVDMEKCVHCNDCTKSCPLVTEQAPPNTTKVNTKSCLQCYACEVACQHDAIHFTKSER